MPSHDRAISEAHRRLGEALRRARTDAGLNTRSVPRSDDSGQAHFSSGHISLVEQGRTAASPELVQVYATLGGNGAELNALYAQAVQASVAAGRARRAGKTESLPERPPHQVTPDLHREAVQRHYVVPSQTAHFMMGRHGEIRELVCTYSLRARSDDVRFFYAGYAYPSDPRPGVLAVSALGGGEVTVQRKSPTGAIGMFVELDRVLAVADADPHELTIRVSVDSIEAAAPFARFHAERGYEHLSLALDFDPAARPATAWWYSVADVIDAEFPEPDRSFGADPGACRQEFTGLVPGWCYGIGWQW